MVNFTIVGVLSEELLLQGEDPNKSEPAQIQTACQPPLSESQIDAD